MNRIRAAAFAALLVCAVSLGAAGTASAAQQPATTPLTKKVAVTGTKGFTGTYTIDRFTSRNGKLVAVGTLKGKMRKKGATLRVTRKNVVMPAAATGAGPATPAKAAQVPPIPGAGNLLGNLLCAITGILNPTGALGQLTGAINNLAAALNAILALVPTSPATAATAAAAGR